MLLSDVDSPEHPVLGFVTGRLQAKLGLPVWGTGNHDTSLSMARFPLCLVLHSLGALCQQRLRNDDDGHDLASVSLLFYFWLIFSLPLFRTSSFRDTLIFAKLCTATFGAEKTDPARPRRAASDGEE